MYFHPLHRLANFVKVWSLWRPNAMLTYTVADHLLFAASRQGQYSQTSSSMDYTCTHARSYQIMGIYVREWLKIWQELNVLFRIVNFLFAHQVFSRKLLVLVYVSHHHRKGFHMKTPLLRARLPKSCEHDGAIRLSPSPSVSKIETKKILPRFAIKISDRRVKTQLLSCKSKIVKNDDATTIFSTRGRAYESFVLEFLIFQSCAFCPELGQPGHFNVRLSC